MPRHDRIRRAAGNPRTARCPQRRRGTPPPDGPAAGPLCHLRTRGLLAGHCAITGNPADSVTCRSSLRPGRHNHRDHRGNFTYSANGDNRASPCDPCPIPAPPVRDSAHRWRPGRDCCRSRRQEVGSQWFSTGSRSSGVDDGCRRARLTPFALAHRQIEHEADAFQRAVPVQQREIVMRGILWRQVFERRLPFYSQSSARRNRIQTRRIRTSRGWPRALVGGIIGSIGSTNAHLAAFRFAQARGPRPRLPAAHRGGPDTSFSRRLASSARHAQPQHRRPWCRASRGRGRPPPGLVG